MGLKANIQTMGSQASYRFSVDAYNPDALGLGPLMVQVAGAGEAGFVGPTPIAVARPMEQATAIPGVFPWAMRWSNSTASEIDWVFLADNAAAAVTRRVIAYSYNRKTAAFSYQGFITLTPPATGAYTIRGFRMTYDTYTTGTVAVSTTAVTGTSTVFSASRLAVGSRIGFGSTDPSLISTWYEISAIGSDTSITLTTTAGSIAGGTSYVIEDLRVVAAMTNSTATAGGLFVSKGLRFDNFSPAGTTIPTATTVDNIRAVYWLADAATVTNTATLGCAIEPKTSWTAQNIYVLDTVANPIAFKYNLRAALSLTAGKDTATLAFKTGAGGALTGTASQANNGRLATASHGPGSGASCIYFTTTTRVYRTVDVTTFVGAGTAWLSAGDVMTEVPPGSVNSTAASALMNSIEYSSMLDKFLIAVNATTTPSRSYVTAYNTTAAQFDRMFGCDNRQIDQTSADSNTTPVPSMTGGPYSIWSEGGIAYLATIGTTAITNRLYAVPLSADWEYASTTNCRIIFPSMTLSDADSLAYVFAQGKQVLGSTSGKNLGLSTEASRLYYRTSGISDNSGSWTAIDGSGKISSTATTVQLMAEFRTIGVEMLPGRISTVGVVYNDITTDSHYQVSVSKSDAATKKFAWRFSTAFGSTVPALKVRLYDAVSGALLVTDNTASPTGTFERSTDGTTFSAWNNTDKGNDTTYLRYTPASLADNITVRPLVTLN